MAIILDKDLLTHQVEQYITWRRDMLVQLARYQEWLTACGLNSADAQAQLDNALAALHQDQLRLAFVGEFSRGKTELINALFFAHYGKKILPSGGGRTTMCPTEIYHDGTSTSPHIRLLPIETRITGSSIRSFKKIPEHWVTLPLNLDNPDALKDAFSHVAAHKTVSRESAIKMGFSVDALNRASTYSDSVNIPAWRYAMISIDHPLLHSGLVILDTPGLNALGCEPDLTFSLLPDTHGICFLLSADTGVSKSDLDIWNRHISDLNALESTSVHALLNKIDSLRDPFESEIYNQAILEDLRQQCARQLSIAPDDIIPLSAREGLIAKATDDPERLTQSNLLAVEALLSSNILERKKHYITHHVLGDILATLHMSRKMLKYRQANLQEQLTVLHSVGSSTSNRFAAMQQASRTEQSFFHKKLILLKSTRKRLQREGSVMLSCLNRKQIEHYRKDAAKKLVSDWGIVALSEALEQFFSRIENDIAQVATAHKDIQHSVKEFYKEYEAEQGLAPIDHPQLDISRYQRQLRDLHNKAGSFRRNLKHLMNSQRTTSKRFFITIANEAAAIYRSLREDGEHWVNSVLLPLYQHSEKHKTMFDAQVIQCKTILHGDADPEQQIASIEQALETLQSQLKVGESIIHGLRRPTSI